MLNKGILVYNNIIKNPIIKVDIPPKAIFSFAAGARVDFISKNPGSLCNVSMIEKYTGEIHYNVTLHGGTFAMSNRKEISPLLIKVTTSEGLVLLDIDLEEWAKVNL